MTRIRIVQPQISYAGCCIPPRNSARNYGSFVMLTDAMPLPVVFQVGGRQGRMEAENGCETSEGGRLPEPPFYLHEVPHVPSQS